MRAEHINAFVEAAAHTFQMMCQVKLKRIGIYPKGQGPDLIGVSAIIGISGDAIGAMIINMGSETACKMVAAFLGEECHDLNEEILDGVGELTNIVAGDAKRRLEDNGNPLNLGLPSVVAGEQYQTNDNPKAPCIVLHFASELGEMSLEASLLPAKQA